MRPIRIEIEGFTAYRKETVIDFGDLDLFVLHGPTGSGKSSVLDAMTFALYGVVPRMGGNHGLEALISTGTTRGRVSLTFESRGETYQVVRKLYRTSTPKNAALHRLEGDNEIGLADGVREVNDTIAEIVGIDYDAFSRAVFLPQGKFAEFMQSNPADRRQVLRDLFQLDYLERMRKIASSRAKRTGARMRELRDRLDDEYADATREALDGARKELADVRESREKLADARESADKAYREYRELQEKSSELAAHRNELESLEKQSEARQRDSLTLERAEAAEKLLPSIDACEQAGKDVEKATSAIEEIEEELTSLRSQEKSAEERLSRAREEAEQIENWKAEIARLEELAELIERRNAARKKLEEKNKLLETLREKRGELRDRRDSARETIDSITKRLDHLGNELQEVGFDPDWFQDLDDARDDLGHLTRLQSEIEDLRESREELEEELEALREKKTEADAKLDTAREAREAAQSRLEDAEKKRDHLQVQNRAGALRAHLHQGDPCPVCEQRVDTVPATDPDLELALADSKRAVVEAKDELKAARTAYSDAQRGLDKVSNSLRSKSERTDEKRELLASKQLELEQLRRDHAAILDRAPEDAEDPAVWAIAEHERLREARTQHQRIRDEIQELEKDRTAEKINLDNALEQLEGLTEDVAQRESERDAAAEELTAREEKVGEDVPDDPGAKANELRSKIDAVQEEHEEARKALESVRTKVSSRESVLEERQRTRQTAKEKLARRKTTLDSKLEQSEFDSAEDARSSVLSSNERSSLKQRHEEWRDRLKLARSRVATLEEELGDVVVVEEEELERRQKALDSAKNEFDEAQRRAGRLEERVEKLSAAVEKRSAYEEELEAVQKENQVFSALERALRSDEFQEFVLEEKMHDLVIGASDRLEGLSGRYQMRYKDDDFWVIDLDNASEEREAKTLSGGETFLASLALALELSEQIQRASGALHIDSLFIDEGFGTLDPETLDTVAEAIESLQETGRLVGVITHVADLRDRLPHRFEVVKGVGGSTIQQESVLSDI